MLLLYVGELDDDANHVARMATQHLAGQRGLDVIVESAGLKPAPPSRYQYGVRTDLYYALLNQDIPVVPRPRQTVAEVIERHPDLALCFSPGVLARLQEGFPQINSYSGPEFAGLDEKMLSPPRLLWVPKMPLIGRLAAFMFRGVSIRDEISKARAYNEFVGSIREYSGLVMDRIGRDYLRNL